MTDTDLYILLLICGGVVYGITIAGIVYEIIKGKKQDE